MSEPALDGDLLELARLRNELAAIRLVLGIKDSETPIAAIRELQRGGRLLAVEQAVKEIRETLDRHGIYHD